MLKKTKWEHAGLSWGDIIMQPHTEKTGKRYTSFRWLTPWVCSLHTAAFRVQVFCSSSLECFFCSSAFCIWGFSLISTRVDETFSVALITQNQDLKSHCSFSLHRGNYCEKLSCGIFESSCVSLWQRHQTCTIHMYLQTHAHYERHNIKLIIHVIHHHFGFPHDELFAFQLKLNTASLMGPLSSFLWITSILFHFSPSESCWHSAALVKSKMHKKCSVSSKVALRTGLC